MSRVRVPGDGPKCGVCGRPAVWSGFCQMEDGRGYCNARVGDRFDPAVVAYIATGDPFGGAPTDEQRVEQLIAHGHEARLLRDRRIVVRLGNGRWYRVVGGDLRSPSLLECSEQPPEAGLK